MEYLIGYLVLGVMTWLLSLHARWYSGSDIRPNHIYILPAFALLWPISILMYLHDISKKTLIKGRRK